MELGLNYLKIILCIFILSNQVFGDLLREDFEKKFLINQKIDSPLTLQNIERLEDAFHQIGMQEIINNFLLKLKLSNLNEARAYVHSCELENDLLGQYQRGVIKTEYKTMVYSSQNFNDLEAFWKPNADLQKAIDNAYKLEILNNGHYASLVLIEWPILCIRPGMILGEAVSTFAHEIQHFLGDEEKSVDYTIYENENDYVNKRLVQSGGEFEAYKLEAKVLLKLHNEGLYDSMKDYGALLSFFNEDGEMIDSKGVKTIILDDYNYKEKFITQYRKNIKREYQNALAQSKTMIYFKDFLYEVLNENQQNQQILEGNLDIYNDNIETFENNIRIVLESIAEGGQYTQEDLNKWTSDKNEAELNVEKTKKELKELEKAIIYHTKMFNLAEESAVNAQDYQKKIRVKTLE